jgi:hypothetical protein
MLREVRRYRGQARVLRHGRKGFVLFGSWARRGIMKLEVQERDENCAIWHNVETSSWNHTSRFGTALLSGRDQMNTKLVASSTK